LNVIAAIVETKNVICRTPWRSRVLNDPASAKPNGGVWSAPRHLLEQANGFRVPNGVSERRRDVCEDAVAAYPVQVVHKRPGIDAAQRRIGKLDEQVQQQPGFRFSLERIVQLASRAWRRTGVGLPWRVERLEQALVEDVPQRLVELRERGKSHVGDRCG
jgi:hypothetical protein